MDYISTHIAHLHPAFSSEYPFRLSGRHVHSWYILLWLPVVPGSHGVFPRLCCISLSSLSMKALSPSRISLPGRRSSADRKIRRLYVLALCQLLCYSSQTIAGGRCFRGAPHIRACPMPEVTKGTCCSPTVFTLSRLITRSLHSR